MDEAHAIRRGIVLGLVLHGGELAPGSMLALEDAARLARGLDLPVTLVHSTADDEQWHADRDEYVPSEPLRDDGRAALTRAVDALGAAGVAARLIESEAHSVVAILQAVSETGADLVVVGKRSHAAADGRRLGSVARSLIHDCPAAVWVARPHRADPPRRILAAADLGAVGERVVRSAARLSPILEDELHVVHALSIPLAVQLEGEEALAHHLERAQREAEATLRAWLGGAPAVTHVGVTSPTQAVLAGVRKLEPGLVVMGTVARHGLAGLVLGNTAERLLDRLDTSLLVIKPGP